MVVFSLSSDITLSKQISPSRRSSATRVTRRSRKGVCHHGSGCLEEMFGWWREDHGGRYVSGKMIFNNRTYIFLGLDAISVPNSQSLIRWAWRRRRNTVFITTSMTLHFLLFTPRRTKFFLALRTNGRYCASITSACRNIALQHYRLP